MKNIDSKIEEQQKKEAELKEKYGKIYKVTTELEAGENEESNEVSFIFKKPKTTEYDRFIKNMSKNPTQAMKNLVISTIVEEDKEKLKETLGEYPALVSSLATQLLKLLGHSDNVNLLKL